MKEYHWVQVLTPLIQEGSMDMMMMMIWTSSVLLFYKKVAAIIDELPLGLKEKYLFCISPVDVADDISSQGLVQFAQTYAKKGIVHLREIFTPEMLKVPTTPTALKELESIHKVLELYVWLSYRLDDAFPDRELAASQKSICSMLIEEFLQQYGWQQPKSRNVLTRNSLSLLSQCRKR